MFRLIRLMICVLLAFVAGVFFERDKQKSACDTLDGDFAGGVCVKGDLDG